VKKIFVLFLLFFLTLFSVYGIAKVKIELWSTLTGAEYDAVNSIVEDFNQSQEEIVVNFVSIGEHLVDKFTTALGAGNPPDLLHAERQWIAPLVAMQAVLPLDDISKYGADLNKFSEVALKSITYQGHIYGIPLSFHIFGLWWNKKLFRQAGLDPNEPPKTLEQLMDYAKKLTQYDDAGNITCLGFEFQQPAWSWPLIWPHHFGGDVYNEETGEILANSPECIKSYEWLQGLTKEFGLKKLEKFRSSYGPYWSAGNPFANGKFAMVYDGGFLVNALHLYAPSLEWGFAPFPSVDGKKRVYGEMDVIVIPNGAKHVESAKKFLAFLSKPVYLSRLLQPLSPIKKEYLPSGYFESEKTPNRSVFWKVASECEFFFAPMTPIWQYYDEELTIARDNIIYLRTTPQEALKEVQENVEHRLKMMQQ